jgi:hypothetical protein
MSSPIMTKATAGNLSAAASLAANNKNIAVFRDISAYFEDQVAVRMTTGSAVATTAGGRVDVFYCYGSTALNGNVSSGGTSVVVTSATGFAVGQKIMVENEIRTITSSGVSGTTLTIDALQNNHTSGVNIYLITQSARPSLTLGAAAANTTYSDTFFLPTGTWVVTVTNTDATNAITVEISAGTITGVA